MKHAERLWTIGDIAKQEHVPPWRVSYAIGAYGIEPLQRAGILRLYDAAGVDAIRAALRRIRDRGI